MVSYGQPRDSPPLPQWSRRRVAAIPFNRLARFGWNDGVARTSLLSAARRPQWIPRRVFQRVARAFEPMLFVNVGRTVQHQLVGHEHVQSGIRVGIIHSDASEEVGRDPLVFVPFDTHNSDCFRGYCRQQVAEGWPPRLASIGSKVRRPPSVAIHCAAQNSGM